jgi:hypothetical protein
MNFDGNEGVGCDLTLMVVSFAYEAIAIAIAIGGTI